jgi:transcriptional regulator with XRE-family HTH domain
MLVVAIVTKWQDGGFGKGGRSRPAHSLKEVGIMAMQQEVMMFGATLKRFREARHVSQSKLAERAGFDHSYVSRLESGARTPTRDAVQSLSQALELERVQQDELLASAGFLPREVSSLLLGEPELTEVLSLLQNSQVPEAYRETMRQVLRAIAEQARLVVKDGSVVAA